MKRSLSALVGLIAILCGLATSHAAFIVEADNVPVAGKANDHFASTPPGTGFSLSTPSTAVGLAGNQSAFGNPANATGPDLYTFSFTPGVDADNTTFPAGQLLGTHALNPSSPSPTLITEDQISSGAQGLGSGLYRVFITWPVSGNVNAAGSIVTVNGNDGPLVFNPVNMNGDPAVPATLTAMGQAGANKWLNIGAVSLTAGQTYTVTVQANAATFVSQRVHGVMWERVIPEPSSMVLAAFALVGMGIRRR